MKHLWIKGLILLFLLPAAGAFAQKKVYVSENVLKTAEWARFKYRDVLKQAINQDADAVRKMLEFSGTVDDGEALEHAVTCLEMIPLATDDVVASVVVALKPAVKKLLLDRFVAAKSLTQKKDLQKPMNEWAPNTWDALNNLPVKLARKQQSQMIKRGTRPGAPQNPAPATPDRPADASGRGN